MRAKWIALALVSAAAALPSLSADPTPGDDRATVISALGRPRGRMKMGARETLIYDRGSVELATGVVAKVKLVSPEEQQIMQQKREVEARLAELERQKRVAAGEAARDALLKDESYKTNSPAGKVAAWDAFRQAHPEVTPPAEFQAAVAAQQDDERKAAAALQKPKEEPEPKLSSSKRRKARRTADSSGDEGAKP